MLDSCDGFDIALGSSTYCAMVWGLGFKELNVVKSLEEGQFLRMSNLHDLFVKVLI
jgi:hypothetical protein